MRCLVLFSCAALFAAADANARPRIYKTGPDQPFCPLEIQLQEYVQAIGNHDQEWMKSLTGCEQLKAGLKVRVLSPKPYETDAGLTVNVRIGRPKPPVLGYTTMQGLKP